MNERLDRMTVRVQIDPPGILETNARPDPRVVIHLGRPVVIGCERGGVVHRGLTIHGDVDIIPSGIASQWTLEARDTALVVGVPQDLLRNTATDLAIDPDEAVLLNRFKVRDRKLEHLAWALKQEMDDGFPSGQLYRDSIALAMACQLLRHHSVAMPKPTETHTGAMPAFRLRKVLSFIENGLDGDLSLSSIAAVSGFSASHCQRAFCRAMGVSIHHYILQRRVEHARYLLTNTRMSVTEVALAAGFAHQSHMAFQMRRLLGLSPSQIRKRAGSQSHRS